MFVRGAAVRACVLPVLVAATALLAGCGGSGSSPASSSASSSQSASASAGGASSTAVTVTETEFKIALSRTSFSPGTYTFVADNGGHVPHALEISGPGVPGKKTSQTLQPGQSAQLAVTLQPGTYELWCPVDGHKGLGMDVKIHVG